MSGGDKSKETFYEILGLHEKCSDDEIKKAYRKLASQHHPDKGGDQATFKDISVAYDTLSDPQKRQEYDMQQNGNPFGGFGVLPPVGEPPAAGFGAVGNSARF